MALELDGDLSLERANTRRWVSIIAVVIPVAAFVLGGAWFIRAYIVPPTVAVHNPTMMADIPPPPPTLPKRAMVEAPKPPLPVTVAAPVETSVKETPAPAFALPMFATLAAAPPSLPSTSPAFADPAQDVSPSAASVAAPITAPVAAPVTAAESAEPAELEPSEPIAGPVPVPRSKPHGSLAALHGAVPLPRPKPTELLPEPDLPAVDRHGVN
jgi:hypothetical protein